MATKIPRGTSSNLLSDQRLSVEQEFYVPIKNDLTTDDQGSFALGNSKRMKYKNQDGDVKELARMDDIPVSSYGTWIGSGSGQTTISIPHGLGLTPAMVLVDPQSQDAVYAGRLSISKNTTHIILTLQVEANTGSNNLTYAWEARL